MRLLVGAVGVGVLLFAGATEAHAWDPFVRANPDVEEGNQAMREGDHAGALEAYERAARALPGEPGVHLNRGLSLLAQGELGRAREAFLAATEPPASDEVRADAYYDMGNAFYREADQLAVQEDHQNAKRLFREAADAYRRSLRARPGNRDAAWNLELALRRLREQEEEQRRQEQEQQAQNDQQQQDQQQQDQQQQDQQQAQNDQQQQDQQQQDQQQQDQQQAQNDQQQQDQQQQDQQQPGDQEGQEEHAESQEDRQDPSEDPQQREGGAQGDSQQQPEQASAGGSEQLPDHVARVLDSLQESEENLERYRARARARRENRQPTKDW